MKKIAGYYSEIEEYDGFYFRYNYKRQELEALDENQHVLTYKELSLEDWEDNNEYWIETFADELSEEAGRWTDGLLEEFGCLKKKKTASDKNFETKVNDYINKLEMVSSGLTVNKVLLGNLSDDFWKAYQKDNGEAVDETFKKAAKHVLEATNLLNGVLEDLHFYQKDMGFME